MAEPTFSPLPANAVYEEPKEDVVTEVNVTDQNADSTTATADTTAQTSPEAVADTTTQAQSETQTEQANDTATQAEIRETIKEVEKIVEKYPEMDEYTGEIFNALLEGKEDVLLNYLLEKNRDYNTMSDYDVVKANIKKANPTYTDEILELKMERQYGELGRIDLTKIDEDTNPEEYLAAQMHNKTVDNNMKLLKLDAFDARLTLDSGKKEIKLPKINKAEAIPDNAPSPEAIEQAQREWAQSVDKSIPEVKEFTYKIGDEDVSYKVSDTQRNDLAAFLKSANGNQILQRIGWMDKDGKQNISKMAGDVLKLEEMQALLSNAYKKGEAVGTKSTVSDIKNIDLKQTNSQSVASQPVDIGVLGFGHLNPK